MFVPGVWTGGVFVHLVDLCFVALQEGAEEKGPEAATGSVAGGTGTVSDPGQRSVSSGSARPSQGASLSQTTTPAGAPQQQAGGSRETLEAKVVRVMQQHMGRMAVKVLQRQVVVLVPPTLT